MALFIMVFRKMLKNKWLVASFMIGLVIATTLVSSIPIYSSGLLQRLLVKRMEEFQVENKKFPGTYQMNLYFDVTTQQKDRGPIFYKLNDYINQHIPKDLGVPILLKVFNRATAPYEMTPEDPKKADPTKERYAKVQSLSNIEDHVRITDGRLPAKTKKDGVYEVLVTEAALNRLGMVLDTVFIMGDPNNRSQSPIKIKPVGTFVPKDSRDPYWFYDPSAFDESLIMDENLFEEQFIRGSRPMLKNSIWYFALDYSRLNFEDIKRFMDMNHQIQRYTQSVAPDFAIDIPAAQVMLSFMNTEKQLQMMLWVLNAPVVLLLFFYVFMVSVLMVNNDKNEIAVLRSRGASRAHILAGYLLEGLLLGAVALAAGPQLGKLVVQVLGASNGFLEFISRKAIPVRLGKTAYYYGAIAAGASILTMLIPAYLASRVSIVNHKQQLVRNVKPAAWHRFFMDFILIGISSYGLYSFHQRQSLLFLTGIQATQIKTDPLLFFMSTLFILGIGLFFMRIYPFMVEGIYRLGRKVWPPAVYAALTRVGRSGRQYQFLMIFLIMTIALGLFSASSARTINSNMEERIRYGNGADVVVEPYWLGTPVEPPKEQAGMGPVKEDTQAMVYTEPDFTPFTQLPGVDMAAKVFVKDSIDVNWGEDRVNNARVTAVDTQDFGKAAWFRNDLLPHHWYNYLNLMTKDRRAVLLSSSFNRREDVKNKIKVGDTIYLQWGGAEPAEFVVYGFVDYWPSWNPNRDPNAVNAREPLLVVAHLSYVQDKMGVEPYQVWLKMKPGASSKELYKGIEDKKIVTTDLVDANQEVIKAKNDPFLMGLNGALTLGFIISLVITFIGFMIYWILSIRNRVLEFGVLRAMGISTLQLLGMMVWEQVLTSGMAIAVGVIAGGITSWQFVPLFQIAYDAASQVPPFRVISEMNDQVKLYLIVAVMICAGLAIVSNIIAKLKIGQALKLGEE